MISLSRLLARFVRAREGNVVVETALVTPFVLLALFGAVDIVRYLQAQDSVIRAVSTTADAIARQNGITSAQVSAFLDHAAGSVGPDENSGIGRISVASVHREGASAAEIAWRRTQDSTDDGYQGACQLVGAEGQAANLPNGFAIEEDQTVIVAEGCFTFVPSFLISRAIFQMDFVPLDIYSRSISASRFASLNILEP